jgi:hypothetical protein
MNRFRCSPGTVPECSNAGTVTACHTVATGTVRVEPKKRHIGNPCGHIRIRSVGVVGIDQIGLIRAFAPRRCQGQHQSANVGNNCRTGIQKEMP